MVPQGRVRPVLPIALLTMSLLAMYLEMGAWEAVV